MPDNKPDNNMDELRALLFDTLRGLKKKEIDIDTATAINQTAGVIVATARVEVEHINAVGNGSSAFLSVGNGSEKTGSGVKSIASVPGGTITTHRMG